MSRRTVVAASVALALVTAGCGRPLRRPETHDPDGARCMRSCEDAESYCRGMWFYTQGDGSQWPLLLVGGFLGSLLTSCSRELDACYQRCIGPGPAPATT